MIHFLQTKGEFKTQVFIWEVIITLVVFTAIYFILNNYKKKKDKVDHSNKDYYTGKKD